VAKPLSDKQIASFRESNARLNIWEGAVRSGKSFISLLRFVQALKYGPPGQAMIVGVSRDAIQRNVVLEICAIMGMPAPTPKSTQMNILGRIIHLVGANDERAQRRIQGSTLALAYCDELTLIPQGFFKMLLSRLSVTGAMLFGTTNPDSPFHWLKADFLSKEDLDMKVFRFKLDDNPSLGQTYIDNLKREYSGLWYKRYIEGEWVLAEGTVYDFFDEDDHIINTPPGPAEYYVIGIDYGTSNPTTFSLIGYNRKLYPNLWLEKEYFYDSRAMNRQKTDTEYVEDLKKFIQGRVIRCIYVDPSAASFKLEMMRQGLGGIIDADNDVINGIRFKSKLLSNGTYKICRCCPNAIREFQTYRWDEKVSLRGEDKPIKEHDHSLDSQRYAIYTHFRNVLTGEQTSEDLDKIYSDVVGAQAELPEFFRDSNDYSSPQHSQQSVGFF
jgi:PBSX family phage terminase large subunit